MRDTVEVLNILLKENYNALIDYKKLAESTENPKLYKFLNRKGNVRYVFGNQLKKEIQRLNGQLFENHQFLNLELSDWTNFDAVADSNRKSAIMKACENAEKVCLKRYDEILSNSELPQSTRHLIYRQRNSIANQLLNLQLKKLKFSIDDFVSKKVSKKLAMGF